MSSAHTKPARGMRDFLPEDVRRREYVIGVIADVYRRYGFEPLETPAVENIETLMGKYGEEGDRLIFKILKRGEEGRSTGDADLALRYDLTVPLARVVAEYRGKLPRFFKRYQVQPVWRADRPQKGRFREFYQCDVDMIGSTSPVVEVELCAAVSDVLSRLGFGDFVIRLNHRHVLSGLLESAGVAPALHGTALVALDKLDKVGASGVESELVSRGIHATVTRRLLARFESAAALVAAHADPASLNREMLALLHANLASDSKSAADASTLHVSPAGEGVVALNEIVRLAESTSAGPHLRVDPSLARGLSYYTGAIMEISVPDLAGSLGGGGRYDGLIGMFSGEQMPACGFSLGLERILVVMAERNMFPADVNASGPDVLVTIFDDTVVGESLRLAGELRAASLRVEVYPDALRGGKDLGKAFKYADARRARFVTVLGMDELSRGEVKIKN